MLTVENLSKTYPTFKLRNVSFHLPKGYIMGFIGQNGAGKTTTLKCILNMVKADSGKVTFLQKDMSEHETQLKQEIGFMFGAVDYYLKTSVKKVVDIYKRFYNKWDERLFQSLLARLDINSQKKIGDLSMGMRAKLGIALALSHDAKLLILDEPTSGLDPVARDDLLDFFQEIIEDGQRSILFSTHITSDLDKCADYIIMIKNGKLVTNDTKDNLLLQHTIVKGKLQDLNDSLKQKLIGIKSNSFGFSALALKQDMGKFDNLQAETPNLEDLMIYYNRGEKQ